MNFRFPIRPVSMLTIMLLIAAGLPAQQQLVEDHSEALRQLAGTRDTSRIDLLLDISDELLKTQPYKAYGYAHEALVMAKDLNDPLRTGCANRALARVYTVTAAYDKALEYQLTAFSQFESLNDTAQMAICHDELGVIYMSLGDYAKAHSSLSLALELNRKTRNHQQIARNYMNMGSNYLDADTIDKGLSYLMVSLMIADSLDMEKEKVTLLNKIGYGYARMGRHEDALRHFYHVLEMLGDKPDDLTRSEAMVNIAGGYLSMKNYAVALKYATDGYRLAKTGHFYPVYRNAAKILSDLHAAQGNYRLAYEYMATYRAVSDSIMNTEKAEQLARIQTLYDMSRIEAENVMLRQENIRTNRRIQTRTLVIILITALVFVLAALLYVLNRMNNRQLALNKKLATQSSELEALNDLKDKFFSFVAHNLKNPFNTIMGFSELMRRSADSKDQEKITQYSGLIYDLSAQVQKVLTNLLDWSRLQRRNFEVKFETVELTSLIKDVVEMNNKEAARKDINLNINTTGNVFVVVDRAMITTVLQNLVGNAINFTPAEGRISIDCKVKDQNTEVTITDTGIGIAGDKLERLFDFDFSQARTGSSDHSGAGLGLVICKEMLHKNGGTISAASEPGMGSSFTFTLPVSIRHDEVANEQVLHTEKTPMDVANDLVLSGTPASEEVSKALSTRVIPQFDEVTRVLSIENLERFSKTLITTGEQFNLPELAGFGKSLASLTLGHQIDQIIKMLPRFREYLDKTMKH
ncbi:MAG: tetratricopeptide repeat-containing sensor histidine kinase [Bacteroidales bacterium]